MRSGILITNPNKTSAVCVRHCSESDNHPTRITTSGPHPMWAGAACRRERRNAGQALARRRRRRANAGPAFRICLTLFLKQWTPSGARRSFLDPWMGHVLLDINPSLIRIESVVGSDKGADQSCRSDRYRCLIHAHTWDQALPETVPGPQSQ